MDINGSFNKSEDQRNSRKKSGLSGVFAPENLEKLESIMYPKHASAGSYLFWEGDPADKLYYIRSGRVKLRKSTEAGKDFILSILQEGDLISEMGMGGDSVYSFSAEVIQDVEIGVIQQKDLDILLYRFGDFAVQFTKWMGQMHHTTQSKFRDLLMFGKSGALASTLIRLSNSCGIENENGILLGLKLTNTELADLVGSTREGVNRILNGLKEEGVISVDNGYITIRNLDHLRRNCMCPTSPPCPKEICSI